MRPHRERSVPTAWREPMIKKALYEELTIHIDKEELGRLLGADPGFEVQNIEAEGKEYRFILSRKTDLNETAPVQEEKKRFL
jgi:hypothetical protein